MSEFIISVEHLCKSVTDSTGTLEILKDVDFALKARETAAIVGASGSGKSTHGKLLAEKLQATFYDADDFHPAANVAKMKSGTPLNDEDRKPWLEKMSGEIKSWFASNLMHWGKLSGKRSGPDKKSVGAKNIRMPGRRPQL